MRQETRASWGIVHLASANGLALSMLMISLTPLLFGPFIVGTAIAYSDTTVAIHVLATCTTDGWCQPELYVERANPAQSATVRVDYDPAWDPFTFNVTVRNAKYVVADANKNYETRGCATFFADCPSTEYMRWLLNRDGLTVNLDSDAILQFRVEHVRAPYRATIDGNPYYNWGWDGSGVTTYGILQGVRVLEIYFEADYGTGIGPSLRDSRNTAALLFIALSVTVLALVAGGKRRRQE